MALLCLTERGHDVTSRCCSKNSVNPKMSCPVRANQLAGLRSRNGYTGVQIHWAIAPLWDHGSCRRGRDAASAYPDADVN